MPVSEVIVGHIVEIFTDGACRGNPGPGGWGVLLRHHGQEECYSGSEPHTTNNRMEMLAAIQALERLDGHLAVRITTDSKYLMQGIVEWLPRWRCNQWKTANKRPVKNQDLWQRLDKLAQQYKIEWCWVKGHSGHRENDIVDQLANEAIDSMKTEG